MEEKLLQVHDYWLFPRRYEEVDAMWTGHRNPDGCFPENLIPKLAVIVTLDGEPAAFMACYQDNSIGVAILDWVCTRPNQSFADSRRALLFGEKAITESLKPNYGLLLTYTLPPVARTLSREGWTGCGEKTQLIKLIE